MAGLEPIRFEKNWFKNSKTAEANWDEIADKTASYALRTNNNLKQVGLDINGSTYVYNGDGRATLTTPIVSRLTTLEATINSVGTRNIGLDLASQNIVKIVGSDGSNLSSTNKGVVTFNESSDAGDLVSRDVTANISITLTGAHWAHDTYGDLTDYILWVLFIDNGTDAILGVTADGTKQTVAAADTSVTASDINLLTEVLVSSAITSTYNVTYLGWLKCDFDDTGNAGGENYWTIQNAVGDVNIGAFQTRFSGTHDF